MNFRSMRGFAALRPDFCHDLLAKFGGASGTDNFRPFLGKHFYKDSSDTLGAADGEGDLIFKDQRMSLFRCR